MSGLYLMNSAVDTALDTAVLV